VQSSEALRYMKIAIEEGRKAVAKSGDNPPVGCVLVQDGVLVARGHTDSPGKAHAEAMAISQLSVGMSNVIAFVTLEPCSFSGRTPSCAQALIDAGISEVYVGIIDPDPRNNGKGIDKLGAAGIRVHVGIMGKEISEELEAYLGRAP